MELRLGSIIREKRRVKGINQERLADYMGVCFQTVSKWETDAACPDVTLLPKLAAFFNITIDELFGVSNGRNEELIQSYIAEYRRNNCRGDQKANAVLMKQAISEFPGDFRLMIKYAWTLVDGPYTKPGNACDFSANAEEIERLCQMILDDCSDDRICYEAIDLLCMTYSMQGRTDKAVALVGRLPECLSAMMLEEVYEYGSDASKMYRQMSIQSLTDDLQLRIVRTASHTPLSTDDRIRLYKKTISLLELIYDESDYHFHHCDLGDLYWQIAAQYTQAMEYGEALDNLESAAKHFIEYDALPDEIPHMSLLVDALVFKRENTSKGYVGSRCESALEGLTDEFWDHIRDTEKFQSIVSLLRRA